MTGEDRGLAGRLVAAGMAHPRPPAGALRAHRKASSGPEDSIPDDSVPEGRGPEHTLTVVVPARDRVPLLDRCLASLGRRLPVVVVDDGSEDPVALGDACRRHGARVVSRPVSGGPAAARNDALGAVGTPLVAMVDSDCTVTEGWLEELVWLFGDPEIAAVAPRIRPRPPSVPGRPSVLARVAESLSPLDLGSEEGEVGPDRVVRYVPTTALVARRDALAGGFDATLSVGEDVDLVWRLVDAGWRVRYVPSTLVHHAEPGSWKAWLGRRFRYGLSAGPLAVRHGDRLAPVELGPWPTAVVLCVVVGRPGAAVALHTAASVRMAWRLRHTGVPSGLAVRWALQSAAWTAVGAGRAAATFAAPALAFWALRTRRGRLVATFSLVTPPLVDWWRKRPDLDPLRWVLASVADQWAYGAGVWVGCIRAGSFRPLIPTVRWGSDRTSHARRSAPGPHSTTIR